MNQCATRFLNAGLLALISVALISAVTAGQYKNIVIDGEFQDWLGVPVSESSDANPEAAMDFRDVAISNDDDYLYIRVRLHSPANYADFHHQVLVDVDADPETGHPWGGVGSELFVEDGAVYQQKNGGFNEGAGSALEFEVSPGGQVEAFEVRISRATLDAESQPFFGGDEITVSILAQDSTWTLADSIQAVSYEFAMQPEKFQGTKSLTDFENTFWFYQQINDPDPEWLLPDYLGDDTWQGSAGFFGFGIADGDYPHNVSVPLTGGRTTYYFRAPFDWDYAAEGVALVAEAFLSDGAVIYLNGDEVRRVRMPEGPVTGATEALGGPDTPGEAETFSLPASALITGENLLMVEVHQAPDSPESLAFGFSLSANDSIPPSLENPDLPGDREVVEGESTVFTLGPITGTEPFDYQWYKDNEIVLDATKGRLEIPVVLQEHAGSYFVEISNASGSVRSREAVLTTRATPVVLEDDSLPVDRMVMEGRPTTFEIDVAGSPTLAFQWYKDDVAIEGATERTHTIPVAALEDSGAYHVTVQNRLNSVSSRKARLAVAADQSTPTVESLSAGSGVIEIRFSEPVAFGPATDVGSYSVPGVGVTSAGLSGDGLTVTLMTGNMSFGQDYVLNIDGVEDGFGNVLVDAVPFRATIVIDGNFSDWTGIDPVATEAKEGDGNEFHRFWVANDDRYLYLRFSFHQNIGALPDDFYYQIYYDGDNDPGTGLSTSNIGSSLMVENGNAWLQQGGGFNEGAVPGSGFAMAPTGPSAEFECRIALDTVFEDGTAVFTADTIGVAMILVSTGWEPVDAGPAEALLHTLADWPKVTDPPKEMAAPAIRYLDGQVEVRWEKGVLETSASMLPGSWAALPEAESPYVVAPDAGRRFFRAAD